jgi:hypothetical protein
MQAPGPGGPAGFAPGWGAPTFGGAAAAAHAGGDDGGGASGAPPPDAAPGPHAAAPGLHSPGFSTHSLLDTVLDGRFKLTRFLSNVSGAYGFPYQGTELATGQPVFIKVLKSSRDGNPYSVTRELEAVRAGRRARSGGARPCWANTACAATPGVLRARAGPRASCGRDARGAGAVGRWRRGGGAARALAPRWARAVALWEEGKRRAGARPRARAGGTTRARAAGARAGRRGQPCALARCARPHAHSTPASRYAPLFRAPHAPTHPRRWSACWPCS